MSKKESDECKFCEIVTYFDGHKYTHSLKDRNGKNIEGIEVQTSLSEGLTPGEIEPYLNTMPIYVKGNNNETKICR